MHANELVNSRDHIIDYINFGAYRHYWYEQEGLILSDLRKDNVIHSPDRGLVIVDHGGFVKIDYPNDLDKILLEVTRFLGDLNDYELSAFRFGFIQNGGILGKVVFDVLGNKYGLSALRNIKEFSFDKSLKNEAINVNFIRNEQGNWISLKKRIGKHGRFEPSLRDLSLSNLNHWRKIYKGLGLNQDDEIKAFKYQYYYHLAAGFYHKNLSALVEALFNLAILESKEGNHIKAAGLMLYCQKLCNDNNVSDNDQRWIKLNDNIDIAISNIDMTEKEIIEELLKKIDFIFHYIWALDDYSK